MHSLLCFFLSSSGLSSWSFCPRSWSLRFLFGSLCPLSLSLSTGFGHVSVAFFFVFLLSVSSPPVFARPVSFCVVFIFLCFRVVFWPSGFPLVSSVRSSGYSSSSLCLLCSFSGFLSVCSSLFFLGFSVRWSLSSSLCLIVLILWFSPLRFVAFLWLL